MGPYNLKYNLENWISCSAWLDLEQQDGTSLAIAIPNQNPIIMETKGKRFGTKDFFQAYVSQVNWDWLFLKMQLIFGFIIVIGLLGFILWFLG